VTRQQQSGLRSRFMGADRASEVRQLALSGEEIPIQNRDEWRELIERLVSPEDDGGMVPGSE
jgi:hypothetical protein